jgi:hypothetical protein
MQVDSGGHKAGCFFVNLKIENLVKFSQKPSRVSQICTRKKKDFPRFSQFVFGKSNKICEKRKKLVKEVLI